jgi:hypothetical protein
MLKTSRILHSFAYSPKIKFLGPRSKIQQHSPDATKNVAPTIHHVNTSEKAPYQHYGHIPSSPSIFLSSLVYPQLSDEQIEIINMGGTRDPPKAKENIKPSKKK